MEKLAKQRADVGSIMDQNENELPWNKDAFLK